MCEDCFLALIHVGPQLFDFSAIFHAATWTHARSDSTAVSSAAAASSPLEHTTSPSEYKREHRRGRTSAAVRSSHEPSWSSDAGDVQLHPPDELQPARLHDERAPTAQRDRLQRTAQLRAPHKHAYDVGRVRRFRKCGGWWLS